MDTREKILGSREAAAIAASGAVVVSGHFDPLIAWHVRWLEGFRKTGRPLLVMITTPENPILPARARAELVASLRAVDHVVEFSSDLALTGVIHLEREDRELFRDLLELVHSRNRAMAVTVEGN